MDISLLTAKLLGIYLAVSGLFLIFRGKTVPRVLEDFFDHPAIVYLSGIVLVFLSSLVLIQYNIWDGTWKTVVTVFVWVVLLKGVAYIFITEALHRMVNRKILQTLNLYGLIAVVAGVSLYCLG